MLKNGQPAKPNLMDRIGRRMSTVRDIDGLWVGAFTNRDEAALQRVEEALQLMEQRSPLHYSRVVRNLDRIWINTLPDARAQYSCRLNTCELDERLVMQEETTPELIASAIVHETTHARLERWGVTYDEAKRHRIEAICLRRELNFVSELTGSKSCRRNSDGLWTITATIPNSSWIGICSRDSMMEVSKRSATSACRTGSLRCCQSWQTCVAD